MEVVEVKATLVRTVPAILSPMVTVGDHTAVKEGVDVARHMTCAAHRGPATTSGAMVRTELVPNLGMSLAVHLTEVIS